MMNLKEHLCAALKASLEGGKVRIPEVGGPLLEAFTALSRARSYGPNGPNPISWSDLFAWSRMMRHPVEPRHVDIIMALDEVWLTHAYSKERQAPEGVKTLPPISGQSLSAALFDVTAG